MARTPRKYLDGETGGFDEVEHPLIEVAWATEDGPIQRLILPHDVRDCDEKALEINHYDERRLWDRHTWAKPVEIMAMFADLQGGTLVCSNPSFDERFLLAVSDEIEAFLMFGKRDPWKHRKIDIASYAMPLLGHEEPMGLERIWRDLTALGHSIPEPTHGAIADVACLRACMVALDQMWVPTHAASGASA